MRRLFALFLVCTCLPACTLLLPEKTLVRGSVWLVSQTDVHQAIAAARAAEPRVARLTVSNVVVADRNELYIYFHSSEDLYSVVRRVDGQWHHVSTQEPTVITG